MFKEKKLLQLAAARVEGNTTEERRLAKTLLNKDGGLTRRTLNAVAKLTEKHGGVGRYALRTLVRHSSLARRPVRFA